MKPKKKMNKNGSTARKNATNRSYTSTKASDKPRITSFLEFFLTFGEFGFEFRKSCWKFLIMDCLVYSFTTGNTKGRKTDDSRYVWCFGGCIWSIGIVFSGCATVFVHFFFRLHSVRTPDSAFWDRLRSEAFREEVPEEVPEIENPRTATDQR